MEAGRLKSLERFGKTCQTNGCDVSKFFKDERIKRERDERKGRGACCDIRAEKFQRKLASMKGEKVSEEEGSHTHTHVRVCKRS